MKIKQDLLQILRPFYDEVSEKLGENPHLKPHIVHFTLPKLKEDFSYGFEISFHIKKGDLTQSYHNVALGVTHVLTSWSYNRNYLQWKVVIPPTALDKFEMGLVFIPEQVFKAWNHHHVFGESVDSFQTSNS